MENTETTGVTYPRLNLDGRVLVVCCSLYAEYRLSLAGLSLNDCLAILTSFKRTGVQDPRGLSKAAELLAASVAENYPDGQAPTADQWMRKVSEMPNALDVWNKEIFPAVDSALAKLLLAARLPATPPAEAPALAN